MGTAKNKSKIERVVVSTNTRELVSEETSELLARETSAVVRWKFEPESYVIFYDEGFDLLVSLGATDIRVFMLMVRTADLNNGSIRSSPNIKRELGSQLGIQDRAVRKALQKLSAAGLLQQSSQYEYTINPEFHWRGSQGSRKEARIAQYERENDTS